jgi:hypothetical protein
MKSKLGIEMQQQEVEEAECFEEEAGRGGFSAVEV